MKNTPFITWDLQEIIASLVNHHPEIKEIYLFGSRAYKTGSLRSDVDLLAITDGQLSFSMVNSWLHDEYPPVDLFTSYDRENAMSVVNGSTVAFRKGGKYKDLMDQLDAIMLWDSTNLYSATYSDWKFQTANNVSFQMSIIPSYPMLDFDETLNNALANLEASGIKTYFAGSSWPEIAQSITNIVLRAMKKPVEFQKKARSYRFDQIKMDNEYDFHNMILGVLRPIFPDITMDPFMVRIDGAEKKADFGIANNKIVIEAKWIDDTSKKATVIKTLDGLGNFYSENSNVKVLIFLILYKSSVDVNEEMLNDKFSKMYSTPPVIVKFIKNEYE